MAYSILRAYWSQLLCLVLGALVTWWVLSGYYDQQKRDAVTEAIALEKSNQKKLESITKEQSDAYEKELVSARKSLDHTKRMFKAMPCAPVATLSIPDSGGANLQRGLPGSHGIATESLFDYSGDANESAIKRRHCKAFVDSLYGINN